MATAPPPEAAPDPGRAEQATEGPTHAGEVAAAGEDPFAERPELLVGAAFLGGLVAARILKRAAG